VVFPLNTVQEDTMNARKTMRPLGMLIFALGAFFGIALSAIAVWGDLEASLFDTSIRGDEGLAIKCPVMLTTSEEESAVSAAFTNSLSKPVTFTIRTHVSQGYVTLMKKMNSKLHLAPGETQTLKWPVAPDDAAYGRFILVRVYLSAKYPLPSRDGSCGILVVDLPYLSGNQIFALVLAASLLGMGGGIGLWVVAHRPLSKPSQDVARAMGVLAGCVLVGMIASLSGRWLFGLLIFVLTVLLSGAMVGHSMNRRSKTQI
jgi:hypothetical protein